MKEANSADNPLRLRIQQLIAAELQVTESTVEKHIAKGLLLCRDALDGVGLRQSSHAAAASRRRTA